MSVQMELTDVDNCVLTLKAITLVPVNQDISCKGILTAKVSSNYL